MIPPLRNADTVIITDEELDDIRNGYDHNEQDDYDDNYGNDDYDNNYKIKYGPIEVKNRTKNISMGRKQWRKEKSSLRSK